jgi:hypothetical protein
MRALPAPHWTVERGALATTKIFNFAPMRRSHSRFPQPARLQNKPRNMANQIKLAYASPDSSSFDFTETLPALPTAHTAISPTDKQAYLSALRAAVTTLQDKSNTELTARMEVDKMRDTAAAEVKKGNGAKQSAVDEAAEEENYGEEVVEED